MINRTAIIINNYNMPEQTDALVEHIIDTVKMPHDLIVVDNGSDIVESSEHSTFVISENVQTTNGFLAGLCYADDFAEVSRYDYFAYWMIITSAEFIKEDKRDPLEILLPVLEDDPLAYAVQPSILFDGEEAWHPLLYPRMPLKKRRIWGIDYISTLFRAEYFNKIGRYRKELTMMWGVPGECNWKARKNGWHIYVHDGYTMKKHTNLGYDMDRMNMTAAERRELASAESDRILEPLYGKDYRERFGHEFRQTKGEY